MNLIFRPSVKPGRNEGSLSLRVIHMRRCKTFALPGCRVFSTEWDKEQQAIIYPENDSKRVEYLASVEAKINQTKEMIADFISEMEKKGRYSVDDIADTFGSRKDENKLLVYANSLAKKLRNQGQFRTANAYETVTRSLVKFNNGEDLPLIHINDCLIKDYEAYLKSNGKMPNTISYHMRNLRAIVNKAIDEKRIVDKNATFLFANVFTGRKATMKRALSLEEIKRLHQLDLVKIKKEFLFGTKEYKYVERLQTALLYFDFCLHAHGMCFIDMAFLKKSNMNGGVIKYIRRKTGQQMEVRITVEMQQIINYFSKETVDSPFIFPIINEKKGNVRLQYESGLRSQNNRLKDLAKLAGVSRFLSTHVARHSWANVGKHEKIPLSVISKCLGHASENTTLIYLDSLENSLLDAANEQIRSAIVGQSAVPSIVSNCL